MKREKNIFIGTSGWYYPWNEGKCLDWYVKYTGLNAIELNASFYRFPFPSYIKGWANRGKSLKWSVKVNRRITHIHKFNEQSYPVFEKFLALFEPLKKYIAFYLFQMPPKFGIKNKKNIEAFQKEFNLGCKFALEPRNEEWFSEDILRWLKSLKITIVSIDAPKFPENIFTTDEYIYLRLHGRKQWYNYDYSKDELLSIKKKIEKLAPHTTFIFFNNDHNMLNNAQIMLSIMKKV